MKARFQVSVTPSEGGQGFSPDNKAGKDDRV